MKLQFKNQDFQTAAVQAVTDLFTGQERSRATFSVLEEGISPEQTSPTAGIGYGQRAEDHRQRSDGQYAYRAEAKPPAPHRQRRLSPVLH